MSEQKKVEITVEELVKWDKKSKELTKQISNLQIENSQMKIQIEEKENQLQNIQKKQNLSMEGNEERIKILQTICDDSVKKQQEQQQLVQQLKDENVCLKQDSEQYYQELQNLRIDVKDKFQIEQKYTDLLNSQRDQNQQENQLSSLENQLKNKNIEIEQIKNQNQDLNQQLQQYQEQINQQEDQQLQQIQDQQLEIQNYKKQIQSLTKETSGQKEDIQIYQQTCEDHNLEKQILIKKHTQEIKEIKQLLQYEQQKRQESDNSNKTLTNDIQNLMIKLSSNPQKAPSRDEKIILGSMSEQIQNQQTFIKQQTIKIQQLEEQSQIQIQKIEILDNLLWSIGKQIQNSQIQTSIKVDDLSHIKKILNQKDKNKILEEVLIQNEKLKLEIQNLCQEINSLYRKNNNQ